MPHVVIDSTCLIALERIDQLGLLARLFSNLVAPPTVIAEFGRSLEWLSVRAVSNQISLAALRTQLHRGEAEAIALAAEMDADNVILDDKKARRIAKEMGLRPLGTVGLIVRAKRGGLVPACRPLLDGLMDAGFHLSDGLRAEALRLAGEED